MLILTKVIYTINIISIKTPVSFFVEQTDKLIQKFIQEFEGLRIAKTVLKKITLEDSCFLSPFGLSHSTTDWMFKNKQTKKKKKKKKKKNTEIIHSSKVWQVRDPEMP